MESKSLQFERSTVKVVEWMNDWIEKGEKRKYDFNLIQPNNIRL